MTRFTSLIAVIIALASFAQFSDAHCQIPCGIYDDPVRVTLMKEHTQTIEKSMNEIIRLSKEKEKNYNQIVRWVNNKDEHAEKLSHIATYYFMAQRLSPAEPDSKEHPNYIAQLTALHRIVFYCMKCKQTTDTKNVDEIRKAIDAFEKLYFHKEDSHSHDSEENHSHSHDAEHGHSHSHATEKTTKTTATHTLTVPDKTTESMGYIVEADYETLRPTKGDEISPGVYTATIEVKLDTPETPTPTTPKKEIKDVVQPAVTSPAPAPAPASSPVPAPTESLREKFAPASAEGAAPATPTQQAAETKTTSQPVVAAPSSDTNLREKFAPASAEATTPAPASTQTTEKEAPSTPAATQQPAPTKPSNDNLMNVGD